MWIWFPYYCRLTWDFSYSLCSKSLNRSLAANKILTRLGRYIAKPTKLKFLPRRFTQVASGSTIFFIGNIIVCINKEPQPFSWMYFEGVWCIVGFWGTLNRNHSIKCCDAIFLEGSPDHTVVQRRGLACVRDEVILIRTYHSVRKYQEFFRH